MYNCDYNILPATSTDNIGFQSVVDEIREALLWRTNPDDPAPTANLGLQWISKLYGIANRQPDIDAQGQSFGMFPYVRTGSKNYQIMTLDTNEPCLIFFVKDGATENIDNSNELKKIRFHIIGFANLDIINTGIEGDYTEQLVTQISWLIKNTFGAKYTLEKEYSNVKISEILSDYDTLSIDRMNIMYPRTVFRLDYEVTILEDCVEDPRFGVDLGQCPI